MTFAQTPADHPGHKAEHHKDGIHLGIWYGPAQSLHGMSKSGQNLIVDTQGTEVWTYETPDIAVGARVRYCYGFPAQTTQAMAIDVTPIEPVAKVEAPKIAPRNKTR